MWSNRNTIGFGAIFYVAAFALWSYIRASVDTMEEICDNAIDDDNDGLIDLNDSDCACILVEPVSLIPNPSFEL